MTHEQEPTQPEVLEIRDIPSLEGEHPAGVDPQHLNETHWKHELSTALTLLPKQWQLRLNWHEDGQKKSVPIEVKDDPERPGHRKAVIALGVAALLTAAGYKFFQNRGQKLGGHFSPFNPHDK